MKRLAILISITFLTIAAFGQSDVKEDFLDAEFFFAEEDYNEALFVFNKVYNKGYKDNANINYRIGVCLLNIPGRRTEAIPYLELAAKNISDKYKEGSFKEVNAAQDAVLYLGNAYRINNELDKAIEQYNAYKELLSSKDSYGLLYTEKQIESCENAREAMKNPVEVCKGNLGQLIQTALIKYNPAVSGDLNTLAFMGQHRFYNGVYVAKKIDDKWGKPLNITPSIQSDGNQNVLSLNQDGTKILLAWLDEFDSDIYYTEWANNRWTNSQPIEKPVNSRFFESHACFTPDEQSIYFTSNRSESLGGMDIFRCDRLEDGSWSDAINLGEVINTPLSEETPFISPDGKRLYFSSQGHSTIGGYDVFYSEIQPDGSWGEPVNIGYPLNTTDDDLSFSPINKDGEVELVVFAKGDEEQKDIFKYDIIPSTSQPVIVAFEMPCETMQTEIAVIAEEVVEEVADTVAAEEVVEVVEVVEEVVEVVEVVEETKELEKYLIKPIFFGFDSYTLDATSKQKLDDFAQVLLKFPDLKLKIIGHTDAVGAFDYNKRLSVNRANSVLKYLADKGIRKERMTTAGLSESEPAAINRTADDRDSPEGRKLNRRVQFKVSITDVALITVEEIKVPDHLKIK